MSLKERRFRFGPQFGGVVPYDVEVTVAGGGGSGSHCKGELGSIGKLTFFVLVIQFQTPPVILHNSLLWYINALSSIKHFQKHPHRGRYKCVVTQNPVKVPMNINHSKCLQPCWL